MNPPAVAMAAIVAVRSPQARCPGTDNHMPCRDAGAVRPASMECIECDVPLCHNECGDWPSPMTRPNSDEAA